MDNTINNTTNTYNFGNYEIFIQKTLECITIRFLDKDLFKVYQKEFTDLIISEICPVGLNNFHTICQRHLSTHEKTFPKNSIINVKNDSVTINIEYKSDINFNFDLVLPFVSETKISSEKLYIKQLETKIEQLEIQIEQLETDLKEQINVLGFYVCNYNYIRGCCGNSTITGAPIRSNKITRSLYDNQNQISNYDTREFIIPFHTCNTDRLNDRFKLITTNCIEIKSATTSLNDAQLQSIFENFPKHINKLILNTLNPNIFNYLSVLSNNDNKIDILEIRNFDSVSLNSEYLEKLEIEEIFYFNCKNFNKKLIDSAIKITQSEE